MFLIWPIAVVAVVTMSKKPRMSFYEVSWIDRDVLWERRTGRGPWPMTMRGALTIEISRAGWIRAWDFIRRESMLATT
jgi:hypothetical protein